MGSRGRPAPTGRSLRRSFSGQGGETIPKSFYSLLNFLISVRILYKFFFKFYLMEIFSSVAYLFDQTISNIVDCKLSRRKVVRDREKLPYPPRAPKLDNLFPSPSSVSARNFTLSPLSSHTRFNAPPHPNRSPSHSFPNFVPAS